MFFCFILSCFVLLLCSDCTYKTQQPPLALDHYELFIIFLVISVLLEDLLPSSCRVEAKLVLLQLSLKVSPDSHDSQKYVIVIYII